MLAGGKRMGNTYFFTGFPGFISTRLVKELIRTQKEIDKIYLLVLPEMVEKSEEVIRDIVANDGEGLETAHFEIVTGDITKEQLDMEAELQQRLKGSVTHVFHLAAIYDLAVPHDLAYRVNVIGTDHVNDWVKGLERLKRYIYFSTAYVAGKREGLILETELEMNQSFKNHYEKTKYEAEILVQKIMDKIPTTIIRPGVVMGDSKTGETIKFDGPYFLLNFFDRLKFLPFIPYLGKGEGFGNFVPVDYILQATIYLAHSSKGEGKVYHLTDPNPYTMKEVYEIVAGEFLGKKPRGMIPLSLAKGMLSISYIRKWLKVEKEALDYFTFKAQHDPSQAIEDLRGSNIVCPDFKDVVPVMVRFYRKHKNKEELHIKIK